MSLQRDVEAHAHVITAFAQFARLPMLVQRPVLVDGVTTRAIGNWRTVLRQARPEGSARPGGAGPAGLGDAPAGSVQLRTLAADLLALGWLDGSWPASGNPVSLADVHWFFDAQGALVLASDDVLQDTVRRAVRRGLVPALGERPATSRRAY